MVGKAAEARAVDWAAASAVGARVAAATAEAMDTHATARARM